MAMSWFFNPVTLFMTGLKLGTPEACRAEQKSLGMPHASRVREKSSNGRCPAHVPPCPQLDQLDQNKAVNKSGQVVGKFSAVTDVVSEDRLSPYSEVFGLQRFRECELIHGRWAMLAALGVLVAEGTTGVAWQDAGKVELDGASYLGLPLPFSISQVRAAPQSWRSVLWSG
jgi:hypothetical protein